MKKFFPVCIVISILAFSSAWCEQGCFTAVAGRLATADGSVLMAHNEDDGIQYLYRMVRFERAVHSPGEYVELAGGGRLAQADTTWEYLMFEMPGKVFSHLLLNEHGVAVSSDNCPSREDKPELAEGGIGPDLRILVAERARTAREGVKLVGSLIERFGYASSGRTLVICDRKEGWMTAMVNGKHWAARRVPDDEVAMIANCYNIHALDLSDTLNFLGSRDIVDYAVKRGWYEPARDGAFDFERAYADRKYISDPNQRCRLWSGYRHVTLEKIPIPDQELPLPFSVKPGSPVRLEDFFAVLRDHYEGSQFDIGDYPPHSIPFQGKARPICSGSTNHGSVFQLRSQMPDELGALWWIALWRPCSSPFLPFFFGLKEVPAELSFEVEPEVYTSPESAVQPGPEKAWRVFRDLALFVDGDYWKRIEKVRGQWAEFDRETLELQGMIEAQVRPNWGTGTPLLMEALRRYCQGTLARAMQKAKESALTTGREK
jgi:dipeptidase